MKKTIFTLAIAALAFTAGAQDKKGNDKAFKVSVGATVGLPIGDAKVYSSLAVAGDLQGEYAAAETVGLTLSAGYLKFIGKSGVTTGSVIPVLVGGKFYFAEKFYGHAQAGVAFISDGGGTGFAYAPGFGYNVSENFDLSVKYQAVSKNGTSAFIGLRAAVSF